MGQQGRRELWLRRGDDAVDLLLGRRGDGLGDQRALSEETGLSRRDAPCSVFG